MAKGRIAGITIEIGADTSKVTKAFNDVNKSLKTTGSSLKDVDKLLKLKPGNIELLTQKQEYLTKAIDDTKKKLEVEEEALKKLKENSTTDEVTEEQKALAREIEATKTDLENLTTEYKNFGTVSGQQIQAAGQHIQQTGQQMQEVGKGMITHVTTPIVAGFGAALKVTADFDSQMSQVGAITNATGDEMDTMRKKAREMGAKTKFSATEAGEAMQYMGMAGWKTGEIVDGLEGIMNLAAASGEDLGTTSDIVTDALTAFGLQAKDSGHFADIMAAAATNANTDVSMMGETFKYAAPVAGALGYTAEDTAVAIGLMANAGIKGSQAGTALRTGMTNLVKPSKQAAEAMDQYGISVKDGNGQMYSLRQMSEQLRQKLGGLDEAEQAAAVAAIFGKNAMSGWLAIINASPQDVDKLTTSIDGCNGTAENMATTMQDNLNGQMTILMSQLQELAISFGEIAMPVAREFVGILQNMVSWFNNLSPSTKEAIAKIAALAAAIGPVLLVGGKVVSGVGTVITVIGKLKGAIGLVGAAGKAGGLLGSIGSVITAAGPLLAGGAVVAGVVAGGVLIYKNWDTIKEKAGQLATGIKTKWGEIKSKTSEVWNSVKTTVETKISEAATQVKEKAKEIGDNIKTKFDNAKKNAVTAITNLGSEVKTKFEETKTNLTTAAENIASSIKTNFSAAKENAVNAITNLGTGIKTKFDEAKTNLETTAGAIATGLKTKFDEMSTNLTTTAGNIASGVKTKFDELKTTAEGLGKDLKTTLSTAAKSAKDSLGSIATAAKDRAGAALDTAKNALKGLNDGLWGIKSLNFVNVATNVAQAAKNKFGQALTDAGTLVRDLTSKLDSFSPNGFMNTLANVGSSLQEKVVNKVDSVWSTLKSLTTKFTTFKIQFPAIKLPHFELLKGEVTILGKKFTYPKGFNVRWYAKAYDNPVMFTQPTVLQTPYGAKGFGDRPGGEIVLSDKKLREIAGSGGNTYTFNIYGADGQNVNELADAIQRRLVALERQKEAAGLA